MSIYKSFCARCDIFTFTNILSFNYNCLRFYLSIMGFWGFGLRLWHSLAFLCALSPGSKTWSFSAVSSEVHWEFSWTGSRGPRRRNLHTWQRRGYHKILEILSGAMCDGSAKKQSCCSWPPVQTESGGEKSWWRHSALPSTRKQTPSNEIMFQLHNAKWFGADSQWLYLLCVLRTKVPLLLGMS